MRRCFKTQKRSVCTAGLSWEAWVKTGRRERTVLIDVWESAEKADRRSRSADLGVGVRCGFCRGMEELRPDAAGAFL